MNGSIINSNFVVGMLVAKELPRQDQVLTGLTAGQLPASGVVGIVGLKRLVDDRRDFEARALKAEAELAASKPGDGKPDHKHRLKERRRYKPEDLQEWKRGGNKEQRLAYCAD